MNHSESTIQEAPSGAAPVADDFLPSLYRSTLILGMAISVGVILATRSPIWAGSFFFGVIASLAFLKAQEVFLKRILASKTSQDTGKAPKTLWVVMLGKYFLLAGIMAAALHFQVLNLIGFVLGFALLHGMMAFKVIAKRGFGHAAATDATRPGSLHV